MKCPFCAYQIAPRWQCLHALTDEFGQHYSPPRTTLSAQIHQEGGSVGNEYVHVELTWARCTNELCHQILVRVRRKIIRGNTTRESISWFAVPHREVLRPLAGLISGSKATDYKEARLILNDSPRMSSVLSRRILADLLAEYALLTDRNLASRIDKFVKDSKHPSRLRENLHYLREIGNFSAHTMQDDQGEIIEVTGEEAEWTLKVVEDLFDYFIVAPETDKRLRSQFDQKLAKAGRKPISRTHKGGSAK